MAMTPRETGSVEIIKSGPWGHKSLDDRVVIEEPMELRIGGESFVVTMRTPGDDLDLAAGFLLTEGWIERSEDIGTLAYCPDEKDPTLKNIVDVRLVDGKMPDDTARSARSTWANSSCGLCGKATLESIHQACRLLEDSVTVSSQTILSLPAVLSEYQANFKATGGIHGAGLFNRDGGLIGVREDIGRHNAVDKVIGAALRSGTLGDAAMMMVSGRLGFEIAQKALVARIPIVASVSAPSSLAVDLAREFGMTAIGFLRGESMNIYSGSERIEGM
jgi:FdhD protein